MLNTLQHHFHLCIFHGRHRSWNSGHWRDCRDRCFVCGCLFVERWAAGWARCAPILDGTSIAQQSSMDVDSSGDPENRRWMLKTEGSSVQGLIFDIFDIVSLEFVFLNFLCRVWSSLMVPDPVEVPCALLLRFMTWKCVCETLWPRIGVAVTKQTQSQLWSLSIFELLTLDGRAGLRPRTKRELQLGSSNWFMAVTSCQRQFAWRSYALPSFWSC